MKTALAILMLVCAGPTLAAETPWQEVSPGVKLRLITSGTLRADGHTMAGLEVSMPPTTRTYWRVPGESGIPAQFDITGSTGVGTVTPSWPYPAIDQRDGYTDFVYWGNVVLPIDLAVTGPVPNLAMAVTLGICSDVCVPAQAKFLLPLDFSSTDHGNSLRLTQALALTPEPWTGAAGFGSIGYDAATKMLTVPVLDGQIDPQSIIVTAKDGDPLFGAPQKSPEPNLVQVPILGAVEKSRLENLPVQLTFMTGMGAYEAASTVSAQR